VGKVDGLMQFSEQGRAAAIAGDTTAARANRTKLLADLQSLQAQVTDAQLKAALASFIAAIRESLRQNRTCGIKCTTSDLARVDALKQQAVAKLNPLLLKYARHT
jgi:hypothetical protein